MLLISVGGGRACDDARAALRLSASAPLHPPTHPTHSRPTPARPPAHPANLVANITKLQPPSRLVTDISDLPGLGLKACVLNRTSHIEVMRTRFPDFSLHVVDSLTVGALLEALKQVRRHHTCVYNMTMISVEYDK